MNRKVQKVIFLISLLLNTAYCYAQLFPLKNYPKKYFSWPVDTTISLSANFGELRPNHYHMGIDCRTAGTQNRKIMAAAEGYIARIKIEPMGFGRAIYINHPNGFTTLYAHLNDFFPELENYVKEQQYKLKNWAVYLELPPHLFPVTKGQFIAYSGNTGASQGPHLHFEIRDARSDNVLNPTLFGFPVLDTIPPNITRLAVYDRSVSTYEQTPKLYPFKKVDGVYITNPPLLITNTDKISFAVSTTDRNNQSANQNGIYEVLLSEDEEPVIGLQLDNINYDETRYFNAHIDYKLRSNGMGYAEHLSELPGYSSSIYKKFSGNGIINLDNHNTHCFKIVVKDADGNSSLAMFEIKKDSVFSKRPKNNTADFTDPNEFHPGFINVYENSNIAFYLPQGCLYDSFRFRYNESIPKKGYPIYQLHNAGVPLHNYFSVNIKASTTLPGKMIMHRFANGRHNYAKAEPIRYGKENDWYRASFREFGSFQLMVDTIPPNISPVGFKDGKNVSKLNRLAFVITDNTQGIKNFTATLDGNWLRFSNDKGRTFIYYFDEMCPAGEHELKIIAEDQVGNRAEKIYHFTR